MAKLKLGLLVLLLMGKGSWCAPSEVSTYILPLSCAELLQDTTPFLSFFEAVAKGMVAQDRKFSRRLYRILALRDKLGDITGRNREGNPIDTLIRKTLCFYREQKEPLKPVLFDDTTLIAFLKSGLKDLEEKVEDTIFQWEFEREQRDEYERRLKQNQAVANSLRREAETDATRSYQKLTGAARKKVRSQ